MPIKEILLLGNPILRTKCENVKKFNDAQTKNTVQDLQETLDNFRTTYGFGKGIAAPQIGVNKKIIFLNVDKPLALLNPIIVRKSRQLMVLWDDCFSFPDLMIKVKRNVSVDVEYKNINGIRKTIHATGDISQLLQHEIDHLDGILAIDRAIDSHHIILRSEWEKLFTDSFKSFLFSSLLSNQPKNPLK
ncbi:MAG: peptide deformylase [Bacteroidota bacterium]|nr:peptide deformylase [Bacteroidota bacterium]